MFNHITPDLLTQISKNSTLELNNKYYDNKQDNFLISQNYTDFEYTNTSNCEYTNFTDLKKNIVVSSDYGSQSRGLLVYS